MDSHHPVHQPDTEKARLSAFSFFRKAPLFVILTIGLSAARSGTNEPSLTLYHCLPSLSIDKPHKNCASAFPKFVTLTIDFRLFLFSKNFYIFL